MFGMSVWNNSHEQILWGYSHSPQLTHLMMIQSMLCLCFCKCSSRNLLEEDRMSVGIFDQALWGGACKCLPCTRIVECTESLLGRLSDYIFWWLLEIHWNHSISFNLNRSCIFRVPASYVGLSVIGRCVFRFVDQKIHVSLDGYRKLKSKEVVLGQIKCCQGSVLVEWCKEHGSGTASRLV